jgi:hypothetical protein
MVARMARGFDRREFLARAAGGALGVTAATLSRSGAVAAQGGMFVSLPPWAVARNVGWPEQARLAARVGYGGIDWAFGAARTAGLDATRALLAELKLRATITNLPMQTPLEGEDAAFRAQ